MRVVFEIIVFALAVLVVANIVPSTKPTPTECRK